MLQSDPGKRIRIQDVQQMGWYRRMMKECDSVEVEKIKEKMSMRMDYLENLTRFEVFQSEQSRESVEGPASSIRDVSSL